MPDPSGSEPRLARGSALALAAAALLPFVLAVAQLGRIHPDEVYQVLEPAFRRAFGYGVIAWEWQVGLRNWAWPLVISWLLRLAAALDLKDPIALRVAAAIPQLLLHFWALVHVHRFAARRTGEQSAALIAALAFALYGVLLTFAGRTMGESLSASFLVIGIERLERPAGTRRALLVAGLTLGLAVVVRYGSAVFIVAALTYLAALRRWRALAWVVLGGSGALLALAGLDLLTWGRPLHSLIEYASFNVFSDRAAAQFGRAPPSYYVWPLLKWAAPWIWPGLLLGLWRSRGRPSLPLFAAVVYIAALSLTAHKEERFLYPALVLLALAALDGWLVWLSSRSVPHQAVVASVSMLLSLGWSAVDGELAAQRSDQFRAIVHASRGDARGLLIVNEGVWGAGGSFYIGRPIPWWTCDFAHEPAFQHAMASPSFNRAVTYDARALDELLAAGFEIDRRIGRATVLVRRPHPP